MAFLPEAVVEQAPLDQLHALGYSIERQDDIGPGGHRPKRESLDEVVLRRRFEDAVARLSLGVPLEARRGRPARSRSLNCPYLSKRTATSTS